jgi:hypothetical protein
MTKIILLNILITSLVVLVHYELLFKTADILPKIAIKHRFKILICVLVALIAHVVEIWIYAFTYFKMHNSSGWGYLAGNFDGSLVDSIYFSFTTFSTLGFGDIEPMGAIRFFVGMESLVGFVLITWTASFLYFEMQKHWSTN